MATRPRVWTTTSGSDRRRSVRSTRAASTETGAGFSTTAPAIWETTELPEGVAVNHVTLIPYRGEKAVVAWKAGQIMLPEGDILPGETPQQAIDRIAMEQAGITDPAATHLGHFRAKATSFHKSLPLGAVTYQALYAVEVGGIADFPSDTTYERRIILQRDLNTLLRSSYVEYRREYTDSLDHYLIERLKANLRQS